MNSSVYEPEVDVNLSYFNDRDKRAIVSWEDPDNATLYTNLIRISLNGIHMLYEHVHCKKKRLKMIEELLTVHFQAFDHQNISTQFLGNNCFLLGRHIKITMGSYFDDETLGKKDISVSSHNFAELFFAAFIYT